jgi:hypothetical protein
LLWLVEAVEQATGQRVLVVAVLEALELARQL